MQLQDAAADPAVLLAAGGFGRIMGGWARRSVAAHAHSELQISFNLEGAAVNYRLEGTSECLQVGQALVIPSWKIHARRVDPACAAFVLVLALCPSWLAQNKPQSRGLQGLTGPVQIDAEIFALLCSIRAAFAGMEPEAASGSHPLIMALIDSLGRLRTTAMASPSHTPPHSWDRRISRAAQLVRERNGRFNVDQIAAEAGISRTQFYRRFKDCFGVPPRLFLNAARMEWAVARLIGGNEPIAEISDELGFSSPGHFSRFFATHTGETPGSFRHRSVELHSGTNG
jgi:AraC family transcriptional regulator